MATHFAGPVAPLSELIENVKSISALDDPQTIQSRYDGAPGNLANNFIGGAPTLVTPARTAYYMVISHVNGQPATKWKYATAALRNTAVTDLNTALTT